MVGICNVAFHKKVRMKDVILRMFAFFALRFSDFAITMLQS